MRTLSTGTAPIAAAHLNAVKGSPMHLFKKMLANLFFVFQFYSSLVVAVLLTVWAVEPGLLERQMFRRTAKGMRKGMRKGMLFPCFIANIMLSRNPRGGNPLKNA